MQECRHPEQRGFTLIEAMIAMSILAIALLGTFIGLVEAARVAREGQLRQYRTELIDAKIQRLLLADKTLLPGMVGGLQTVQNNVVPANLAIGGAPWIIDPSAPDPTAIPSTGPMPGDLGVGAVFRVLPDGEIRPIAGTFSSCADPTIPAGAYCRELLLQNKLVLPGSALNTQMQAQIDAVNARTTTLWIRISKKGEISTFFAVVERKVLVL
jgi:prepilin-type N-terminal cleavage/methylation domain-containing protein